TPAAREETHHAGVVYPPPAISDAVAPSPLGEPFGDPRRHAVATVAERHHRQHAPGDLLGGTTIERTDVRAAGRMELLVARIVGVDLDRTDVAVWRSALVDVAALDRASVALHG